LENKHPQIEALLLAFGAMPVGQLVFFALFAGTWLIGGNVLIASHYKRIGKHWASGFKPFAFPFKDFNAKEWQLLLGLAVMSLAFLAIAMSLGH